MGILQKYIEDGSKYKSLEFGKDQPEGGSSKQPFMQNDINTTDPIQPGLVDFPSVLRGGAYAGVLALTDIERLTKYFKTPSGIQFIANQNLLSRVAPRTEAFHGLFFNGGIYTPLSTLAQAGVGIAGGHLNKQGLDPTGTIGFLSIRNYGEVAYDNNTSDPNYIPKNRLVLLTKEHIGTTQVKGKINTIIQKYPGGPGSFFGLSKTKIRFATKADGETPLRLMGSNGENPKTYLTPSSNYFANLSKTTKLEKYDNGYKNQILNLSTAQSGSVFSITNLYNDRVNRQPPGSTLYALPTSSISFDRDSGEWKGLNHAVITFGSPRGLYQTYLTPGTANSSTSNQSFKNDLITNTVASYKSQINPYLIINKREIVDQTKYNPNIQTMSAYASGSNKPVGQYDSTNSLIVDPLAAGEDDSSKKWNLHTNGYLANLNKSKGYGVDSNNKIYLSPKLLGNHGIGPDFRTTDRNVRGFNDVHLTGSYYDHVTEYSNYWTNTRSVDNIYYKSTDKRESSKFGLSLDIIKFNVGIVNPDNAKFAAKTLNFRAYIDNLSDSYDADWSAQTYMGRGEKLWKYNSFGRTISLGFTVVAEGPEHLEDMYNHLNILASSLAPSYVGNGYMAGNIHKLTIGNYITNQYGIITGLTFDIDNESPWEINQRSQLPHFIKVTGFKFTPIHDFRPEYSTVNSHDYIAQNAAINPDHPSYKKPISIPKTPSPSPAKTPANPPINPASKNLSPFILARTPNQQKNPINQNPNKFLPTSRSGFIRAAKP
jgi:hypothetical protein